MIKKIGETLYNKIVLQAEEAHEQGFKQLGDVVLEVIGDEVKEDEQTYSYAELKDDVYKDLWKIATRVMAYHDISSVDIGKLHKELLFSQANIINELELSMNIQEAFGPNEPSLPGEK